MSTLLAKSVQLPAARPSQVPEQVDRSHKNVEVLLRVVGQLEERLSQVTLDVPAGAVGAEPAEQLAPLASSIRGVNDLMENAIARLESLRDRIEL